MRRITKHELWDNFHEHGVENLETSTSYLSKENLISIQPTITAQKIFC